MKIIALQTGSTAPFIICDHGDEGPGAWLPVAMRKVDVRTFVKGTFAKPKNMGNTLFQHTFTVSKTLDTCTAAQIFLSDIHSIVPKQGPIRIDYEDQVTTRLIPDATIEVVPLKVTGMTADLSYTIKYGCEMVDGILCDTGVYDSGGSGNILFSSDAAFPEALYTADKAVFLSEDSTPFNGEQDPTEASGTDSQILVPNGTFVAAAVENRTFGIYPVT